MARLKSIFRKEAIRLPVQPPVPGRGIPTNRSRPRNSPLARAPDLFMARCSIFSTKPLVALNFFRNSKIFCMKRRIKGSGRILPITASGIASTMSTLSRDATSRPPLHSRMGIIDTMNTTAFADIYCPSVFANHIAILSIYYYLSCYCNYEPGSQTSWFTMNRIVRLDGSLLL